MTSTYTGTCRAEGCQKRARSFCKEHYYGDCAEEGCTNLATGGLRGGLAFCQRHLNGPQPICTMEGCQRVSTKGYGGLCQNHRYPFCAVGGCRERAPDRNPLCYTHQRRGADYIKAIGMRPELPGLLYVVHHPELEAIKVGIGVALAGRVAQHIANGWAPVLKLETAISIGQARALEQAAVRAWRAAGVPVGALAVHMPQAGHTETAPGTLADARALAAWVEAGDPSAPPPLPAAFARHDMPLVGHS